MHIGPIPRDFPLPVLPDRYRIEEAIAMGGTGAVWRAHDRQTETSVAIKVPRVYQPSERTLRLFRWEAEMASAVHHEHVVRVLATDTSAERYTPHVVTEMVYGRTLADVIADEDVMSYRQIAQTGAQLAAALGAVHAAHLVHRDVKPDNVLLTQDNRVKLTDFGYSASTKRWGLGLRDVVGTRDYLTPEMARMKQRAFAGGTAFPPHPSRLADMYGLGLILHELTTGKPVFDIFRGAQLQDQVDARVPPLSDIHQDVPPELDKLVGQLTARVPRHRPASAMDVSARLAAIAAREPGGTAPTVIPVRGLARHTSLSPAIGADTSLPTSPKYAPLASSAGFAALGSRGTAVTRTPTPAPEATQAPSLRRQLEARKSLEP